MENVIVYTVEIQHPNGTAVELIQTKTPQTRNCVIPGFRAPVPREHHRIIRQKLNLLTAYIRALEAEREATR
jgi:hypothetical protein